MLLLSVSFTLVKTYGKKISAAYFKTGTYGKLKFGKRSGYLLLLSSIKAITENLLSYN